jgi:HEAT repeat protein
MDLHLFLKDKSRKAKEKTEILSRLILDQKLSLDELLVFAKEAKAAEKATCIEAIEFATKTRPDVASEAVMLFVCESLKDKAPRVKWESAKVIGNIVSLFPKQIKFALPNLLTNSEDKGTVVRWSAAYALGEILKLKSKYNSACY